MGQTESFSMKAPLLSRSQALIPEFLEVPINKEGMAGRQGFEPRLDGPEPSVLPLDDLTTRFCIVKELSRGFKGRLNIIA